MECFEKGLKLIWRNETTVKTFALKNLAYKVIDFEDAVTLVTSKSDEVDHLLEEIKVCEPIEEEYNSRLAKIQRIVEEFSFNDYSNLEAWVENLNGRIEDILVARLGSHLESWVNEFRHTTEELEGEAKLIQHDFVLEFQIMNA
jgi:dynein heavy chain 1